MTGESEILLQFLSDGGIKAINTAVWFSIIAAIWSVYWKGIALWIAAGNKNKTWFIVLLLVNTLGILEILYIYFFSKRKKNLDK